MLNVVLIIFLIIFAIFVALFCYAVSDYIKALKKANALLASCEGLEAEDIRNLIYLYTGLKNFGKK